MEYFPNQGQTGMQSIRIAGQKIDQLGWIPAAHVKSQIPLVEDTERQNKINEVICRYPTQKVPYLESRVTECNENIVRINQTRAEQSKMIAEYTVHITLCALRDKELEKTTNEVEIKALKKKYPPYNVPAMEQQIVQCREGIERCDDVIQKENDSLAELAKYIGLCKMRDNELKNLNVKIG